MNILRVRRRGQQSKQEDCGRGHGRLSSRLAGDILGREAPNGFGVQKRSGRSRMDANQSLGLPRAMISRSALLHNAAVIRSSLRPGTRLCAMVKADAYGHDAGLVADTLTHFSAETAEAPVVDALAVATLDEAEALAQALGVLPVPVHVLRPVEHVYVGRQRERIERAVVAGHLLTVTHAA